MNELLRGDYDTVVECKKCGRKQYLKFANGLKNGWSRCCGYTMPILHCEANIDKAVKSLDLVMSVAVPVPKELKEAIENQIEKILTKEEPWSVS